MIITGEHWKEESEKEAEDIKGDVTWGLNQILYTWTRLQITKTCRC